MSYHTQLFHEEFYFLKKNFPTTFTRDFTKLFGKKKTVSSNVYQSFFDMCWAHSLMPKSVLCMRRESGKLWNFLLILIKSSQCWIYLSYASRWGNSGSHQSNKIRSSPDAARNEPPPYFLFFNLMTRCGSHPQHLPPRSPDP